MKLLSFLNKNVVYISAGIWITPLISILKNSDIKIIKCLHVDRSPDLFPFQDMLKERNLDVIS